MRLAALAILACVIAAPACASQKSEEEAAKALIACAPKTYDAALTCLDTSLPPDMKDQLRKPKGTVQAHFGLGMFIRNNWGLWQGGDLAKAMGQMGFTHPDDMSATILDGYAARLNGQRFDLAAEAGKYRAYWAKQGKQDGCLMPSPDDKDFAAKADAAFKECERRWDAKAKEEQK